MSAVSLSEITGFENPDREAPILVKKSDLSLVMPWSVGIEFELENLNGNFTKQTLIKDLWNEVRDGSLRGDGMEFITRIPVKGDQAIVALENIYEAAKGSMAPLASLRTSAHVHVNVLDMTAEEAAFYMAAGALAEPYILSLTDDYRKYCGYCLDSINAAGIVLSNMHKGTSNLSKGIDSRYYGVNAQSIYKHGTLEFRHFAVPPTLEEAVRNINVCLKIKQVTKAISKEFEGKLHQKGQLAKALDSTKVRLIETLQTHNVRDTEQLLERVEIENGRNERYSAYEAPANETATQTAAEEVRTAAVDATLEELRALYGVPTTTTLPAGRVTFTEALDRTHFVAPPNVTQEEPTRERPRTHDTVTIQQAIIFARAKSREEGQVLYAITPNLGFAGNDTWDIRAMDMTQPGFVGSTVTRTILTAGLTLIALNHVLDNLRDLVINNRLPQPQQGTF